MLAAAFRFGTDGRIIMALSVRRSYIKFPKPCLQLAEG